MQTQSLPSSFETGTIGIFHLKRYWAKAIARRNRILKAHELSEEWTTDITLLGALGLGLEQTLVHLYQTELSFEEFERWVLATGGVTSEAVKQFNNSLHTTAVNKVDTAPADVGSEPTLSDDDLAFWEEHGYVVIHNAVTPEACRAAERAVWEFLGIDEHDPATWYTPHPARQGIMVQFFQHPALQANRIAPRIRRAYEQLWGTRDLWVNTDRVSFNPPEDQYWCFPGPDLHWDTSIDLPIPLGLQGLLYLTDTDADQGAFTLVPGFHRRIADWLHSLPADANPRQQNLAALGATPIAGKAGDFILWHHALPHGSRPNTTSRPRIVQYINWQPRQPEQPRKWR